MNDTVIETQQVLTSEDRLRYARIVTIVGLILNLLLAAAKITVSVLYNNLSLLADGLDSALDLASTLLGFVAVSIALRPADKDHHFGHTKFENLFSLGIAILLVASSGIIGYQAVVKLINHTETFYSHFNVIISVISIITKTILVLIYVRIGKKINSPSLIANGKNFRTDILTSIVVLVSVTVAPLSINSFSLYWVDSAIALIISVIIIITAIGITREASTVLLDQSPDEEIVKEIERIAKEQEGVIDIANIRARNIGSNIILVDLDILLDPKITLDEGHDIACRVEDAVKANQPVKYIQIHMEPYHTHNEEEGDTGE